MNRPSKRARPDDQEKVDDTRVGQVKPLIPPACVLDEIPLTDAVESLVASNRREIADVVSYRDDRLIVIVGPCSIHNPVAALEYAKKLMVLKTSLADDLIIIMRVYFEKPRTTIGWKGLINDPDLNGTYNVNKGLRTARQLLSDINGLGLGAACEFLDVISPQFFADLVSWGAIGARTTESQVHRELASGLSPPIGFKNGTTGNAKIAIDAVLSATQPHRFLGVTKQGLAGIIASKGNVDAHVILRGGTETGPNYASKFVKDLDAKQKARGIEKRIVIDCSHGNSNKDYNNQPKVSDDIAKQITAGENAIGGVMIESNITEGGQKLDPGKTDVSSLTYGQSVTDSCVSWATTEEMLTTLAAAVRARRAAAGGAAAK